MRSSRLLGLSNDMALKADGSLLEPEHSSYAEAYSRLTVTTPRVAIHRRVLQIAEHDRACQRKRCSALRRIRISIDTGGRQVALEQAYTRRANRVGRDRPVVV